jgi:hypothetical protein
MNEPRFYIVETHYRDDTAYGKARFMVSATSRAEAISQARARARAQSRYGGRVTHIVSARLAR